MKNILVIVCIFFGTTILAQNSSLVHLKNGSILRGKVMKNDSTGVTLHTRDGNQWNFAQEEIISVEPYAVNVNSTGFYNKTSIGVLGGDQVGASFRVVNGYSFNRHWEVGFGVGFENFTWTPYVPLFLEGRYNFLEGHTRPFISAHAGYELPLRNLEFNKGGLTTGIDMGITHYITNRIGLATSVGYRFAILKENSMWWDDFTTISQINRFEIRLGLVFR